jgi:sucrose-phosphate synthase
MKNKKGYYIQLFSVHGLVRHENMELGRDADTGGQVKYVVELAKKLSESERVRKVDLFTRLIDQKDIDDTYSIPVEIINEKLRIVRIQCGGRKYIRKELLWPHMQEYIDKTIKFIKKDGDIPDFVHGHYADAGYIAMELSEIFGIDFIFTGHSLGRIKFQRLISEGMDEDDIIKKYRINYRINREEDVIKNADLIVCSTNQELKDQYGVYNNSAGVNAAVIPPGIDIEKFYPYYHDIVSESSRDELSLHAKASVIHELNRFLTYPDRPLILALCRPDKRKNISGLIKAYGEDKELQAIANLAVFAGIRKDIHDKEDNERDVLTEMLLLMDKYDLYGKMAIPKKHDFEYEVPELYRITAERKGVFVNAALTEPFGLTLLEAGACGVPIVATNDGGPIDIIKNCRNGVIVNPLDEKDIASNIKAILVNDDKWNEYSKNGIVNVRKHYTWESHAEKYLDSLDRLTAKQRKRTVKESYIGDKIGKRLTSFDYVIITDIDNTLIGDDNSGLQEFIEYIKRNRKVTGFGVATGRTVDSAVSYLKKYGIPDPDIIISSVGSEIYYGPELIYDRGWEAHISHKWGRDTIKGELDSFDFLEYQEEAAQRNFKVSYNMEYDKQNLKKIHARLTGKKIRYSLIYSHNEFLDILPYRASKGKAIRYLSFKWSIPLENFIVAGDSGNDEDMLRGEPRAIVVGNYSPELESLKGLRRIYFSGKPCSAGIIEGLANYKIPELKEEK